jgi:hypothetical protein
VVVTGASDSKAVIAHVDTGSRSTSIDPEIAVEIGAEPPALVAGEDVAPRVAIVVELGGLRQSVTATLDENIEKGVPLRIGRDVLRNYYVDVHRPLPDAASV